MDDSRKVFFVFLSITIVMAINATSFCDGNMEVLCKESERRALLSFKQDLKDPMNRLSSWVNGEGDCCSWTGVACHNLTGHVLELRLGNPYDSNLQHEAYSQSKLSGKIGPSLLNLNHLSYLDLSNNDFEGIPIPSFIGSLKSLANLDLSQAGFGGVIPHQLGNLSNLRYLNFENSFERLLKVENLQWISGLNSLNFLDMSGVNLSTAYDWVQVLNTLPSLAELRLLFCDLGHVSYDLPLVNFTSLSIFDASGNQQFGLPKWLFGLRNLNALYLQGVSLEGPIPFGLTNMTRLKILDLSANYLNSTIPQWFGTLHHLEILHLRANELEGSIPGVIGNLTSLISLNLSSNQLEGKIPESLGNLCKLRELQLRLNKFSGAVSEILEILSACSADSLEKLSLRHNQLSGELTNQLGRFGKLVSLYINDNLLSGPIPKDIGKLSNLQQFDVSQNKLNGSLPESLGQLVKLESLHISHNSLKGMVHEVHFANLTRLKFLRASGNSLTLNTTPNWLPPFQLDSLILNSWNLGPKFPTWIQRQQHLFHLQISNAGVSGTIPIWFCNFSSQLSYLNLSNNQFHGPFPCSISNYSLSNIDLSRNLFNGSLPIVSSTIETVDFSNNSFSGSLSHFFCDKNIDHEQNSLVQQIYLFLGNNLLSGAIPNCWTKWKSLYVLSLENNNLAGVIPSSMGNLTNLLALKLRNNSLAGELPLFVRYNTKLRTLDLSGNKLIGKIPNWMGTSLPGLMVLNLRSNNFEGNIPLQLCDLMNLQVLDLAHNNLSGTIPRCFYNLTAMKTIPVIPRTFPYSTVEFYRMPDAEVVTKGRAVEYTNVLTYVKSIDLSANNLYGEFPVELTTLHLQTLNLSKNHLVGKIPSKIGDMRWLESLDLSQNQLSGEIPASISSLSFLSYLNMSCNNLTGRIPTSTQLQSFNESSFIGNQLCGPPLQHNCSATDHSIPPAVEQGHQQDHLLSRSNLYLSLGLGFAFGFWAVFGSLLFNVPWRIAFCRVVDRIVLRLYAFVVEIF